MTSPPILRMSRDKVVRFRNHPSIAVWCARNEGYPPKSLDDTLKKMMGELDPTPALPVELGGGPGRIVAWALLLALPTLLLSA